MSSQLEDLKWVTPTDLRGWIQDSPRKVAVVDVRGGDFGGGHIKGCYNFSSNEFTETLPQLYQRVNEEGIEDVVFHCRSSKNRGTRTTLEFINSIKDLPEEQKQLLEKKNVWVLKGGFLKWQENFGADKDLTEDYNEEEWKKIEEELKQQEIDNQKK